MNQIYKGKINMKDIFSRKDLKYKKNVFKIKLIFKMLIK
jgi:hypothetical protein